MELRCLSLFVCAWLALGFASGATSPCWAQVWASGESRQRAPNLIGEMPREPPRSNLFLPRMPYENMTPRPIRADTIPWDNLTAERMLPMRDERRTIDIDPMVKEEILPRQLPRGIQEPAPLPNDTILPTRLNFGSTIFAPALQLPSSGLYGGRDTLTRGDMPKPNERRALGW